MGISGLWKELQPVCRTGHISQLRGQRVGVDAYCWLHRAVIASAMNLVLERPCDRFIAHFISRVELLQQHGVEPVVVFDGAAMPMKAGTDAERRERRHKAQADARALLLEGRADEAQRVLVKAMDVSKDVVSAVIQCLKEKRVEVVVAPREADAQLAYMCKEGYVQAVVSEDSDLLVYNCELLVAKLDGRGNCDFLHLRDVPSITSLSTLTRDAFVLACILSGCDYLASLPNVGIKTALKVVGAARPVPTIRAIVGQLAALGFSARELQPYEDGLHRAYYCFKHHLVYDPHRRGLVPFTPLGDGVAFEERFLGALWDDATAQRVCGACELDPNTLRPYEHRLAESVKMYLRRVKGGQTSLHDFGFTVTKAASAARKDGEDSDSALGLSSETELLGDADESSADEEKEGSSRGGGESMKVSGASFGPPQRRGVVGFLLGATNCERAALMRLQSAADRRRGRGAALIDDDESEHGGERSSNNNSSNTNDATTNANEGPGLAAAATSASSPLPPRVVIRSRFFAPAAAAVAVAHVDGSGTKGSGSSASRSPVEVPAAATAEACNSPLIDAAVLFDGPVGRAGGGTGPSGSPSSGTTHLAAPPYPDPPQQQQRIADGAVRADSRRTDATLAIGNVAMPTAAGTSSVNSQQCHESPPELLRAVSCPHGYDECGQVHSIFVRCFEGKGWRAPQQQQQQVEQQQGTDSSSHTALVSPRPVKLEPGADRVSPTPRRNKIRVGGKRRGSATGGSSSRSTTPPTPPTAAARRERTSPRREASGAAPPLAAGMSLAAVLAAARRSQHGNSIASPSFSSSPAAAAATAAKPRILTAGPAPSRQFVAMISGLRSAGRPHARSQLAAEMRSQYECGGGGVAAPADEHGLGEDAGVIVLSGSSSEADEHGASEKRTTTRGPQTAGTATATKFFAKFKAPRRTDAAAGATSAAAAGAAAGVTLTSQQRRDVASEGRLHTSSASARVSASTARALEMMTRLKHGR